MSPTSDIKRSEVWYYFQVKDPKHLEWHCSSLGVGLHNGNKLFEEESGIGFHIPSSQNHFVGIDSQQRAHGELHLL